MADIIGSALYVAQSAGLTIDFKNIGNAVAFRIVGLSAISKDGEISVVPLQKASPPVQNATTEPNEMPPQANATATP